MKYKLVLSGSGTRFPAFLGAIKRLKEAGLEIEAFAGTSGGALVSAALASGLSLDDVESLCLKILPNTNKLLDPSVFNLLWNWGLSKGKKIEEEIRVALANKKFKDLLLPLKIITVNYNKVSVERPYDIFCSESTPEFDVTTAVRASMSIPIAFEPVVINGDKYIDGGMTSNFGLDAFGNDVDNVLGLYMAPASNRTRNKKSGIFGFVQFLLDLVDIFIIGSVAEHRDDSDNAKVINIETSFSGLDFSLTEDDIKLMLLDGYNCVDDWFRYNKL